MASTAWVIAGMNFACLIDALLEGHLPSKECFVPLFAKALGYAIVLGSSILKLPQVRIQLIAGGCNACNSPVEPLVDAYVDGLSVRF